MLRKMGARAALSLSTFSYVTTETLPIGLLLPAAPPLAALLGVLVVALDPAACR